MTHNYLTQNIVDLYKAAVSEIRGLVVSFLFREPVRCLQNLWIIDIQLSEITVDLQHSAVCAICGSAISSCQITVDAATSRLRYLWVCNIQLSDVCGSAISSCQISVDSATSRLRYLWICNIQLSDVCGSATSSCLRYLWICNIQLSDICGCSNQPSEISVDMQHPAVRCLWICNVHLSVKSVDKEQLLVLAVRKYVRFVLCLIS